VSVLSRNNVHIRGIGDRAMVFAHGFGCDQSIWRHVAPRFETEFVTVLFDHVGAGASDLAQYDPDKYADLRGYARDVVELGEALQWEDAIFVGHSCSAMIGALASIEAPHMFERLVLIGPSPRYLNDEGYEGGFSAGDIEHILDAVRRDYHGWSTDMAPLFMGNASRPELAQELQQSFARTNPAIAADFAQAIFTSDVRSDLKRVAVNALILQCASDPVAPPAVGEFTHRQLAHSTLKTLAVEGHFPHLCDPEKITEAIRQFVSVKPDRPGAAPTMISLHAPLAGTLQRRPSHWSTEISARGMSDAEARKALEELLLRRAGELMAQLGRFDMHALATERLLNDLTDARQGSALTIHSRGDAILATMRERGLPNHIVAEFAAIQVALLEVLHRHEIAARNSAVIPHLISAPTKGPARIAANPRSWYEFGNASDEELAFFVDAMERDIAKVASLYLRLADCAVQVKRSLTAH
jgi:sigma-B regulation protein RsbQ